MNALRGNETLFGKREGGPIVGYLPRCTFRGPLGSLGALSR